MTQERIHFSTSCLRCAVLCCCLLDVCATGRQILRVMCESKGEALADGLVEEVRLPRHPTDARNRSATALQQVVNHYVTPLTLAPCDTLLRLCRNVRALSSCPPC